MKRKFSRLEIVLITFIFLFVGYSFATSKFASPPIISNRTNMLRQRVVDLVALQNQKKYPEIYDNFLSSSIKDELSKSEAIEISQDSKTFESKIEINDIVIRDNTGYVDRTLSKCLDENCTKSTTVRGYVKWVFENSNWYVTSDTVSCLRKEPYEKPAEFDRALSLVEQRVNLLMSKHGLKEYDFSFFNCLDIQYADLPDSEGLFVFDPNNSSIDKLQIMVNTSYKENDDLLTAFLLSHEIFHASNYLNKINFGMELSCVDDEIEAFSSQITFAQALNPQEHKSINNRFRDGYYQQNAPLRMMWDLWRMKESADMYCGKDSACYDKKLVSELKDSIVSNPFYKEQCDLN